MRGFDRGAVPLVPDFREKLPAVKEEQAGNRLLCGRSYSKESPGNLCVDEMGNLIRPGYGTTAFPLLPEHNGLRKIRYHDLRHPYVKLTTNKSSAIKQKSQTSVKIPPDFLFRNQTGFSCAPETVS